MPWSFMVSRIITGVTQIIFPYFMYHYFVHGNLNGAFHEYANGADYMTYIVLGSALNVLAVSTLMNIGSDAVYQGYLSDTKYTVCNYEPGLRDHVSDSISSGRSSICGADIPADACCQSVSKCDDRASEPGGESVFDSADCPVVRSISADRYYLV